MIDMKNDERPRVAMLAALLGTLMSLGCAATNGSVWSDNDGGSDADSAGAGGQNAGGAGGGGLETVASSSSSSGPGGSFNNEGGGNSVPPDEAEVFGHTAMVLYRLDPLTKEVTEIGPFKGCGQIIDIAIDKDNKLYGTTFSSLYTIDKNSAVCTLISHGQYSNSLSFVPKGTADPLVEALVGYAGNKYIRIDPVTGDTTTIGALGGGYASSGDIVSVKNGGTYLTVVGNGCQDCLAEVDPVTGALIKNLGPLYHVGVYGLAYWGGSAYGFSSSGKLFEIHFAPNSVTTTLIPIPNAPSSLQFWGAGSSTHVPLVRPK
jgi:hypothetical protein